MGSMVQDTAVCEAFDHFSRCPTELRSMIWAAALTENHAQDNVGMYIYNRDWADSFSSTTATSIGGEEASTRGSQHVGEQALIGVDVPSLAAVNREAREAVLRCMKSSKVETIECQSKLRKLPQLTFWREWDPEEEVLYIPWTLWADFKKHLAREGEEGHGNAAANDEPDKNRPENERRPSARATQQKKLGPQIRTMAIPVQILYNNGAIYIAELLRFMPNLHTILFVTRAAYFYRFNDEIPRCQPAWRLCVQRGQRIVLFSSPWDMMGHNSSEEDDWEGVIREQMISGPSGHLIPDEFFEKADDDGNGTRGTLKLEMSAAEIMQLEGGRMDEEDEFD